jgi:hypothetical protein
MKLLPASILLLLLHFLSLNTDTRTYLQQLLVYAASWFHRFVDFPNGTNSVEQREASETSHFLSWLRNFPQFMEPDGLLSFSQSAHKEVSPDVGSL